jgi:hypothetical protein
MTAGELFLYFMLATPVILFFGMAYGDYQAEGKWPWTKEKKGVNSGAKFG